MLGRFYQVCFWGIVGLAALCISGYCYLFPIKQVSDFGLYWDYSVRLGDYVKGGFLLFLLMPFRALDLPSSFAAMVLHASAFVVFALALAPSPAFFRNRYGLAWMPVVVYGLCGLGLIPFFLITWLPTANFTEVMFVHTALVAFALRLIVFSGKEAHRWVGTFLLFAALTMRMQSVFGLAVPLYIAVMLAARRKILLKQASACMAVAVVGAVMFETGMTSLSIEHDDAVIQNQRYPLYNGLFVVNHNICGGYNPAGEALLRAEIKLSTAEFLRKNIARHTASEFLATMGCKLHRLFTERYYPATYWMNIYWHSAMDTSHDALSAQFQNAEQTAYVAMRWFIGILGGWFAAHLVRTRKRPEDAPYAHHLLFLLAVVVANITVFAVFEFNERYVIPVYGVLIAMMLNIAYQRHATPENAHGLQQGDQPFRRPFPART
jgi:hypothetical protein